MTLGAGYGYVLLAASNMISDGSELLLLTQYAALVGPVVLPILGAIPDGAMIAFSGSSQKQLAVGVGALAGSTIMLLTIPWGLASISGRVNTVRNKNGKMIPNYKPPKGVPPSQTPPRCADEPWYTQLFSTGVSVDGSISSLGYFMLLSSIPYLIIQGPAFGLGCAGYGCGCPKLPDGSFDKDCLIDIATREKPWAMSGLVLAVILFFVYLFWQYVDSMAEERRDNQLEAQVEQLMKDSSLDLRGIANRMPGLKKPGEGGRGSVLERVIKKKFDYYDTDGSGDINGDEWRVLASQLGADTPKNPLMQKMKLARKDDDSISYSEFQIIMTDWMDDVDDGSPYSSPLREGGRSGAAIAAADAGRKSPMEEPAAEDEEDDGDDELPEELKDLSPEERTAAIWRLSFTSMGVGTFLVLLFADPLVGVLGELGERTGVPAFYIAFIMAPLASNASELIAAMNYASKKTKKTYSISLANLLGAACMNNTFCLAIFLWQVYGNTLIWEYSAETISIIICEVIFFFIAQRKHHLTIEAPIVLLLFPLSLGLVWFLENIVGLD